MIFAPIFNRGKRMFLYVVFECVMVCPLDSLKSEQQSEIAYHIVPLEQYICISVCLCMPLAVSDSLRPHGL